MPFADMDQASIQQPGKGKRVDIRLYGYPSGELWAQSLNEPSNAAAYKDQKYGHRDEFLDDMGRLYDRLTTT